MCTIMTRSGAKFWWKKDLPRHIAYLYHNGGYHFGATKIHWQEVTYAEIFARKKAKQDNDIRRKRDFQRTVPCYIWTFYNDYWLMGGWYVYIESRYGSWALNFRSGWKEKAILEKIQQKYSCGILFVEFLDQWADAFCQIYPHKAKGIKTKQGIKFTHCVLDSYNNLIDVL